MGRVEIGRQNGGQINVWIIARYAACIDRIDGQQGRMRLKDRGGIEIEIGRYVDIRQNFVIQLVLGRDKYRRNIVGRIAVLPGLQLEQRLFCIPISALAERSLLGLQRFPGICQVFDFFTDIQKGLVCQFGLVIDRVDQLFLGEQADAGLQPVGEGSGHLSRLGGAKQGKNNERHTARGKNAKHDPGSNIPAGEEAW